MNYSESWDKFEDCAARALPREQIAALFERLETLDKVVDMSQRHGCCRPARSTNRRRRRSCLPRAASTKPRRRPGCLSGRAVAAAATGAAKSAGTQVAAANWIRFLSGVIGGKIAV